MTCVKLEFTKEYIDKCVLEDSDIYTFDPGCRFSVDEVAVTAWVAGWSLRVIGGDSNPRVVATPTNRRTGNILRLGKTAAIRREFPSVPDELIHRYVSTVKGFPYVWETAVQRGYFQRAMGWCETNCVELPQSKSRVVKALLKLGV